MASAVTHGLRFSLARRELEASWGVANLEVPLSEVCQTDGFYWFISHLLAHLPQVPSRFTTTRSTNTARLMESGARTTRSPRSPSRESGWRRRSGSGGPNSRGAGLSWSDSDRGTMDLRIAGEDDVLLELPLAPDREACCAVERLRTLADRAVRLRTRALTTTLFSRFMLGDLFIHGIGGAKYDELGDEIARRFFGIEPPEFLDGFDDALARLAG